MAGPDGIQSFGERLSWAIDNSARVRGKAALAEKLDMKPPQLSQLLSRKEPPSKKMVSRLGDALGVSEPWLMYGVRMSFYAGSSDEASLAAMVREEAGSYARSAGDGKEEPPEAERPEWIPRLIGKVLEDPSLSGGEKAGLVAELNAAGMRYWAISAEWSAGQRGIAMQQAEMASMERAKTNGEAERSAIERARTLRERAAVGGPVSTSEPTGRAPVPVETMAQDVQVAKPGSVQKPRDETGEAEMNGHGPGGPA